MKKRMIIGITAVIAVAVCFLCFCRWFLSETGSTYYYAQIDNSKIEKGTSREGVIDLQGGMDYYYTLPAYDENGSEKDITFGTSRELREGAFIRLTVMPLRGVIEWSEVQYDELPVDVQSNYAVLGEE